MCHVAQTLLVYTLVCVCVCVLRALCLAVSLCCPAAGAQCLASFQCPAPVCSVDVGKHGTYVVAGCMGGIVSVHALPGWFTAAANGAVPTVLSISDGGRGVKSGPGGAAVAAGGEGTARIIATSARDLAGEASSLVKVMFGYAAPACACTCTCGTSCFRVCVGPCRGSGRGCSARSSADAHSPRQDTVACVGVFFICAVLLLITFLAICPITIRAAFHVLCRWCVSAGLAFLFRISL